MRLTQGKDISTTLENMHKVEKFRQNMETRMHKKIKTKIYLFIFA